MTNRRKGRPAKKNPAARWYLFTQGTEVTDPRFLFCGERDECVAHARKILEMVPDAQFVLGRNWPPS